VIIRVSSMGILMKRSFISNVMSLWFSFNLRFVRIVIIECEVFIQYFS